MGFISKDAVDFPVLAEHIDDCLRLPHLHSDFTRARYQQCIEDIAPNLKSAPRAATVLSKALKATRAAPFNPNAPMARKHEFS
jgi:hypothetical protein